MEVPILGVLIRADRKEKILLEIENIFKKNGRVFIATPNPEILLKARKRAEFHQTLQSFDIRISDGIGLVFASRFLGAAIPERVSGVDLIVPLAKLAADFGQRILLVGDTEEVNRSAVELLGRVLPGVAVTGIGKVTIQRGSDGWDCPMPVRKLLDEPTQTFLLVALGAEKQEEWILEHAVTRPHIRGAIGIGGALAMLTGKYPRAPRFLHLLGLEWLWRLILEPRRFVRIWRAVIVFPLTVIYDKIIRKG
jgi:N-acetylglucosaminyldiphosphoundecaprenol N-acetyl-beta-D-mannosaminyltransferase